MSNYGLPSAGTSYDDEDRLTGFARASGTFTQSWSLTSVGDWNSITTNGTAQNRTHFLTYSRHPYTDCTCPDCSTSSSSLSPPASGLLPDFDNKLKSTDVDNNGSNDVTFQYDALGRRVARQGTSGSFVYVQHDQQTIADYGYGDAPSSPTHRYVVASYIDEPVVRKAAGTSGTIHYYHRNQQYSITAVTTSSGSVAERYAYTAYGQPTILDSSGSVLSSSAINNRYTYTGREWDQTLGLYHFRARWMSGLAGRFMGRDAIGYEGSEWGLYEFVDSNPCDRLDPERLATASVSVGSEINDTGLSACSPGLDLSRRFHFELEYRISGRLTCSAILVRKVTVKCSTSKCSEGGSFTPDNDSFTYFEMKDVNSGQSRDRRVGPDYVGHTGPRDHGGACAVHIVKLQ
jgi:RHS repeat-associated protein